MFKEGTGVKIDLVYATMWFMLAASADDQDALRQVEELREMLDESEFKEAHSMGANCLEKEFVGC